MNYLQLLVEDIHSTIVSTIGEDGHPQVRAADMMLWDEGGVYFLTAEGKAFYRQLIEQGFLALAGVKDGRAVSLRGKVRCIGQDRLDDIFAAAPYMREIYPEGKRGTLRVFVIYEATGEYFDISDPSHVVRDDVVIGGAGGDAGTGAAGGTVGGAKTYHVTDRYRVRCLSRRLPSVLHRCVGRTRRGRPAPLPALRRLRTRLPRGRHRLRVMPPFPLFVEREIQG